MSFHLQRVENHKILPKNRKDIISKIQNDFDFDIQSIFTSDIYTIRSERNQTHQELEEVFTDEIIETLCDQPNSENLNKLYPTSNWVIEVGFKPGVTDNKGMASSEALRILPNNRDSNLQVFTGSLYFIDSNIKKDELENLGHKYFGNFLLNSFEILTKDEFIANNRYTNIHIPLVQLTQEKTKTIDINLDMSKLMEMNKKNCWALNEIEIDQIKEYYNDDKTKTDRRKKGLPQEPTDIEIEIIAQSWSEHCKHKIFAANIDYSEGDIGDLKKLGNLQVNGLFNDYIRGATKKIIENNDIDWAISLFKDNAGIVRFDDHVDACIKVETHNSPSALDPYGGALTGILGVNRDILGVGLGAKPIANTDVFCFADGNNFSDNKVKLPHGLLHPDRILEGVHKGVEDGGNKSGIPTVNGAIYFDDDFSGKPLVFVGTVGVIPRSNSTYSKLSEKYHKADDNIIMVGGKIGKDGIHGATFSSMELDEKSPATAVQIGDPITQKRVLDFMMEARDKMLFTSVTDNGAGGLSSSVGEMAEFTNGADIDLELAPVKYPGLAPYELMISESQERMTFAVSKEKTHAFLELAKSRSVDASVLGKFTNSGYFNAYYGDELISSLNLKFLHESLRPMELKAKFDGAKPWDQQLAWHKTNSKKEISDDLKEMTLHMLSTPNIKSKEKWVRQYDQEVQAATLTKPYEGTTGHGPSQSGVIWMKPHGGQENNSLVISCGIKPRLSHYDTYLMAKHTLDEAVRNSLCSGGNPDRMSLLDNFCWPDPIEGPKNPDANHKLAQLVRCCYGLHELSVEFGMPFVSGKDSMKNDFIGKLEDGSEMKISVPPTVLITAMAQNPDINSIPASGIENEGENIFLIGNPISDKFTYSEFLNFYNVDSANIHVDDFDGKERILFYRKLYKSIKESQIKSISDISDGGIITALAESLLGENLGADISLDSLTKDKNKVVPLLFNEPSGLFLASVSDLNLDKFTKYWEDDEVHFIGKSTKENSLKINLNTEEILNINTKEILNSWSTFE
jgi:phosphoribosylformylglycinamidine synthase II